MDPQEGEQPKQSESCTWCKGQGFIKKSRSIAEINWMEWLLVVGGLIVLMVLAYALDQFWAVSGLVLLILLVFIVPLLQGALVFGGALGLITKKVPCPHCSLKEAS